MQYRTFSKTDEKVSLLGFGSMRLPVGADGKPDEAESIRMIRKAIDSGVNYVDTAFMYHGGQSEVIVGKALKDGYREKVFLADKLPLWGYKEERQLQETFDEQLSRLGDSMIDMYLIHGIDGYIWKQMQKLNAIRFVEEKKAEGKIKHIGFSFHGDPALFKEALALYPWDFCQIQLNYMDAAFQAGVEGLRYAAEKGVPVIIMEPLKGGKLTDSLPGNVKNLWQSAETQRTPAEWALRWVADFPEVLTILSGMSSMAQLEENLKVLEEARPNSLTEKEKSLIEQVADEYNRLIQYSCTACRYCAPCPQKIEIPSAIGYYNEWFLYAQNKKIQSQFDIWMPKGRRPSDCTACKACEEKCPQHLPISEIMKKAAAVFE